jgi:alpha-L-fucosidase 2
MFICTESTQAQKYVLWFSKPGTKWEEAIPVGNGRLGAMVRGGIYRDTLSLNEETLWAGEPKDKQNYEAHKYLPGIRSLLNERNTCRVHGANAINLLAICYWILIILLKFQVTGGN